MLRPLRRGQGPATPSGQTPDEQRPTEGARNESLRVPDIYSNAILLARVLMVLSSLGLSWPELADIVHHPSVESARDYHPIKCRSGGDLEEPLVRILHDGGGKGD